jgi:hypothetical protein
MAQTSFPLTTDALADWLNESIRKMQKNLDSKRVNNSGSLRQSLGRNIGKNVVERGGFIQGKIEALDYWYYVDQGVQGVGGNSDITGNPMSNENTTSDARYRTKKPPLKEILGWVQTKLPARGNDLFTALNIREGIYRKGIKATNFASSVVNEKSIEELTELLAEKLAEDMANNITED